VFIVGAPRSGTSILYRTLLKHPAFSVVADEALALAESGILDSIHSAPRWKPPRPPRLWLFFLRDDEVYDAFTSEVRRATEAAPPVPPGDRPPWTADVLGAFVRHASTARSCRRLLEKTPTHIDRAEWLLEALPDARLLFIHRHPLDTYTSYLRRARVDARARSWAQLTVEEFAEVYVRHARVATTLARRHPDRFIVVAYEAFTADPATNVAALCDFVGEPFEPGMVEEDAPDLTRSSNDPHLFGAITQRTKSWEDYIDPADAAAVEDATREAAEGWGHPRRTRPA
jgi:hypothetical protein